MFVIDGLFLVVQIYHMQKVFVSDIMMLDNQIPFEVLRELQTCLHVFVNEGKDDDSLSNKLVRFCEEVFPLKLANESQICGDASRQLHLLDHLYELIVNKVSNEQGNHEMLSRKKKVACINDIKASVREKFPSCFSCRSLLGQMKLMTSTVFSAAWHMFSRKEEERAEDEKINAQEIRIPSVSLLHNVMNVEFKVAAGGISSIEFSKEHLIFYLPTIIINENTEVILRNLVAYEATRMKSGDILQFAEYVDLMCWIIDKPRDVRVTEEKKHCGSARSLLEIMPVLTADIHWDLIGSCYKVIGSGYSIIGSGSGLCATHECDLRVKDDPLVGHPREYERITHGDFNEVRSIDERFGSMFNQSSSRLFNHFITSSGLVDVKLEGYSFTWAHPLSTKMSKLDHFLVSEGIISLFLSITALCLDRHLSDHRPILLREIHTDYGPIPFRFYHSWFKWDGFNVMVEQAYQVVDMDRSVSRDEIRVAVWNCGENKSPGPDGGSFPKGSNSSFIALIPKVTNVKFVTDFRPISLIGCVYKVVTKILANRLATVISDLVSDTQSTFVANRQILEGPFILNGLLAWCKRKKKQAMIFKADFAKAWKGETIVLGDFNVVCFEEERFGSFFNQSCACAFNQFISSSGLLDTNKSYVGVKKSISDELVAIDKILDTRAVSDKLLANRLDLSHKLHELNQLDLKEAAQKAKVKWAIEGGGHSATCMVVATISSLNDVDFRDVFASLRQMCQYRMCSKYMSYLVMLLVFSTLGLVTDSVPM
nr:RNA-directed DNA polymerase, eukaryota [Tanacetum cinerariifolium]